MRLLRWLPFANRHPIASGPHGSLTIALVADELTRACLRQECRIVDPTPADHREVLLRERPDLVFVESAWLGYRNAWKYRIAAYPDHPERTNAALVELVRTSRELGIPAVFWNKEDGVHFERFIASARLFDHVFTVDANCIERYRAAAPHARTVQPLMFAVSPSLHRHEAHEPRLHRADFVGSYSRHIHDGRRSLQDMLLATAARRLGLTVYDRNSSRREQRYRYPDLPGLQVRPAVPHGATARIYRDHLASLNVNTVVDSPTMYSRRLVEILACGGLAVTTPADSVDRHFAGLCHVVHDEAGADELFARLQRDGLNSADREMMRAGAACVAAHHTWAQRLCTVLDAVGIAQR
jgi:spore maturation protein CgeB